MSVVKVISLASPPSMISAGAYAADGEWTVPQGVRRSLDRAAGLQAGVAGPITGPRNRA